MKKPGAIVVILRDDESTLILKRPAWIKWGASQWAFPGGKLEKNETPLEAAIRETKEETSLEVKNLKLLDLDLDMPVTAYYTRDYLGNVKIDFEHDDWAWARRADIESYDLAPGVLEMYDWVLNNE